MEIHKKTWPELFQKILEGKKKFDLRLADFEVKEGDIIVFEEFDPKSNKYTGRKVDKKISFLLKTKELSYWKEEEINKKGFVVMSLEDVNTHGKAYKSEDSNNINMLPGNPQGLPDESFFDTLVLIDEAFLSKLSKYFGQGKYIQFDRFLFAKNLAEKENLKLKKVFIYIAPPFQSATPTLEEERRKVGYDSLINHLKNSGLIVREGRCQRIKLVDKFSFNQKAVDILIAMDLMSVPIDYPSIKKIIFLSSDSDFVPLIRSLEEKGVKTILYTYYEKKRNTNFSRSNHLIKSVYKYKVLSKEDLIKFKIIKVEEEVSLEHN